MHYKKQYSHSLLLLAILLCAFENAICSSYNVVVKLEMAPESQKAIDSLFEKSGLKNEFSSKQSNIIQRDKLHISLGSVYVPGEDGDILVKKAEELSNTIVNKDTLFYIQKSLKNIKVVEVKNVGSMVTGLVFDDSDNKTLDALFETIHNNLQKSNLLKSKLFFKKRKPYQWHISLANNVLDQGSEKLNAMNKSLEEKPLDLKLKSLKVLIYKNESPSTQPKLNKAKQKPLYASEHVL